MTAVEKETGDPWQSAPNRRADLLLRLSSDPRKLAAERRALPKLAEARLWALLREIDETVLPRVLHVHAGARDVARLIVSQRSLIAVEMPGKATLPGDASGLAERCAARLAEIAGTPGTLSIRVRRRSTQPNHAEASCSVHVLELALGLTPKQDAYDRLLKQAETLALARLCWSDKTPRATFSGAAEWAGLLQAFAERQRSMGGKRPADARLGPLRMEGIAIPLSAELVLVIARLEKKGFAAILPREAGLEAIAACQTG